MTRRHMQNLELRVSIWKTVIDVQKHFNDLEMKIRQFAIAMYAAYLGVLGLAIDKNLKTELFSAEIPATGLLSCGAFLAWFGFYFMDRHWYHRLLLGAVLRGQEIEDRLASVLPEIQLSKSIGETSPINIPFTKKKLHSKHKIDLFYGIGFFFILIFIFSSIYGGFSNDAGAENDGRPAILESRNKRLDSNRDDLPDPHANELSQRDAEATTP